MDRPQSGFLDFLDWVKAPGKAVASLATGNPRAAGHYAADFLSDIPDALLPGDVIPNLVTPEDDPSVAAAMGMDRKGAAGRTVDTIADAALNPLSWVAMSPGARKVWSQGVGKVGTVGRMTLDTVVGTDTSQKIRLATGMAAVPDSVMETLQAGMARKGIATGAADAHLQKVVGKLGGLTQDENKAMIDIIENLDWTDGKNALKVLDPANIARTDDLASRIGAAQRRADTWVSKNPGAKADKAKLYALLENHYQLSDTLRSEAMAAGQLAPGQSSKDYVMRIWDGPEMKARVDKKRSLSTPQAVADFANEQLDLDLSRDYARSMAARNDAQGALMRKAEVLKRLGVDSAAFREGGMDQRQRLLDEALAKLGVNKATDAARYVESALGMRGSSPDAMANAIYKVNSYFKPAVVYGTGPFVRLGSITRNQLTSMYNLMATPEGRTVLANDPTGPVRNLFLAFDDGLRSVFGGRVRSDEVSKGIAAVEEAYRASGGSEKGARQWMERLAASDPSYKVTLDAMNHGILSGFVSTEAAAKALVQHAKGNPLNWVLPGRSPVADVGGKIFGGLEQRMRYGTFLDMATKQGKTAAEAAQFTRDTFLDYAMHTPENAAMRRTFPFAQFVVGSMKQQAGYMKDNPAYLVAAAALMGHDPDSPEPGWAEQQAHVPIPGGVMAGLSHPAEVFNIIPNVTGAASIGAFSQTAGQAASSTHPLIKTAMGFGTGVDPFSRRPFLSDARLPGRSYQDVQNTGDALWGLGDTTGLLSPVSAPAKAIGKFFDDKGSAATDALQFTTGLNAVTPDPLRVERDDLRATLQAEPSARPLTLYRSDVPDVQAAIRRLAQVQKELAAMQKQAAVPTPQPSP